MKLNWRAVIVVVVMSAGVGVGVAQVALGPNDIVTWHVDTVVVGGLYCHLADDGFTATACHLQEGSTLDDAVSALLRANKVATTNLTDEREAYDRLLQRFNKFLEQIMVITAPSGNAKTATPKPQPKLTVPKVKPAVKNNGYPYTQDEISTAIVDLLKTHRAESITVEDINDALAMRKPSCGPNAPMTVLGEDGMCRVTFAADFKPDIKKPFDLNIKIGPMDSHCDIPSSGRGQVECSWKANK